MGSIVRARAFCGSTMKIEWKMLPSGLQMQELSKGDQGDLPVTEKQTVRVDYVAKLDDGSVVHRGTSSWKLGSAAVCAALDEGVIGMCVGDRRRLRAPPFFRRGTAVAHAPDGEAIEYDLQLTGAVHHMQLVVMEPVGSDDPLQMLWEFSKRSLSRATSAVPSSLLEDCSIRLEDCR